MKWPEGAVFSFFYDSTDCEKGEGSSWEGGGLKILTKHSLDVFNEINALLVISDLMSLFIPSLYSNGIDRTKQRQFSR